MTKGLPELKAIYALMGAPDAVAGHKFEFPHNDNQVSREYAYAFFNKAFALGPRRADPRAAVRAGAAGGAQGVRRRASASGERTRRRRRPPRRCASRPIGSSRRWPRSRRSSPRSSAAASRRRSRIGCRRWPRRCEGSFRSLKGDGFTVHQSVMARAEGPARVPAIGIVPDRLEGRADRGVGARARQAGGVRGRWPHAVARGEAAARRRRRRAGARRVPDRRVRARWPAGSA